MKNSLNKSGLSLSQAASISNLCYQRGLEITNKLTGINNASKTVDLGGQSYEETTANPIPANVKELVLEKAKLHATQAFLMENIKAKDRLLKELRLKHFETNLKEPERPKLEKVELESEPNDEWGWEQLSVTERAEYLEAEAFAAHIGQFIHKGSPLDKLRTELPTIKKLEFISVKDGERTPVKVSVHHTSEDLLKIHEDLAAEHRTYEQKVNYFKAKVKNLYTAEIARVARINADKQTVVNSSNSKLLSDWNILNDEYKGSILKESQTFEAGRQAEILETATLRITVEPHFKEVVDGFLANLG